MRTLFPLNRDGAVTTYLVSEPKIEDFEAPYTLKDQLRFEKEMRDIFYLDPNMESEELISRLQWRYYAKNRNPYVDFSSFYFTLKRVSFGARTVLVSDKAKDVRVRVWSYAAFDMWLAGKRVATEKVPVYQPIRYTDLTLELSEGENEVLFYIQNFGVRDTRNLLKLEIVDRDGISVTLPLADDTLLDLKAAEEWMLSLHTEGESIIAHSPSPFAAKVDVDGKTFDYGDGTSFFAGNNYALNVNLTVHNTTFSRRIEFVRSLKADKRKENSPDKKMALAKHLLEWYEYGKISPEQFHKNNGHATMNAVLTSLYVRGELNEYDEALIRLALKYINTRNDCADFELSDLLYMALIGKISEPLLSEVKKVALNFRYWMDEEGADAMCFWSENHSLTFYGCQAMAGMLWPDETFVRSGRDGNAQLAVAKRRIAEWFDTVLTEGFEEFLAGGYMAVTVAIVVKLYDVLADFRDLAKETLDRIALECATQCYKGVHVAPMGRVYRGVIMPYKSGIQSLLHIMNQDNVDYTYIRLANLFYSSYVFPDVDEIMTGSIDTVFNSGRAEIHTRKNKDTILTSVASPRFSEPPHVESFDTENYRTKIMNESFHGTSLFEPGKGGYQQHLWYAGISERFLTFVNLPGDERDFGHMRPGYWFGNLIFPAVRQRGRELVARYIIPSSVPTKFTHAFYPVTLADESYEKGNFRFARVSDSYLALYCSLPLELWQEDAITDSELRAYGDDVAWYVKVGSKDEDGSFDKFISECKATVSLDYCLRMLSL